MRTSPPVNPALIYVSITPFGQDGPKARWAATDLTVLAAGGPLILTGDDDRAPVRLPVPQAFLHAGAEAAVARADRAPRARALRPRPARRRVGAAGGRARDPVVHPGFGAERARSPPPGGRSQARPPGDAAPLPRPRRLGRDHVPVRLGDRRCSPGASCTGSTTRAAATRRRATRTGSATPSCCGPGRSRSPEFERVKALRRGLHARPTDEGRAARRGARARPADRAGRHHRRGRRESAARRPRLLADDDRRRWATTPSSCPARSRSSRRRPITLPASRAAAGRAHRRGPGRASAAAPRRRAARRPRATPPARRREGARLLLGDGGPVGHACARRLRGDRRARRIDATDRHRAHPRAVPRRRPRRRALGLLPEPRTPASAC